MKFSVANFSIRFILFEFKNNQRIKKARTGITTLDFIALSRDIEITHFLKNTKKN